ncbi:MAG: adenylate/guanylate cyclase protein, partial [Verrucomicrobiales bacterium]|nr:adenylate/guanylate cyclase protein [Verrucomicrobiales bacterium]
MGAVVGATLVLLIGLICFFSSTRLSKSLSESSYDWSFGLSSYLQPDVHDAPVVIVYLDEDTFKYLDAPLSSPLDRKYHAQILDRLKADGAMAVIFDIVFSDEGAKPKSDADFEAAIRRNGKVILAADYTTSGTSVDEGVNPVSYSKTMPFERFRLAAAGVGMASLDVEPDSDFIVRRHYPGLLSEDLPSLSWAAARFLQLPATRDPDALKKDRWVHYYGPPGIIPHISYSRVLDDRGIKRGFFH